MKWICIFPVCRDLSATLKGRIGNVGKFSQVIGHRSVIIFLLNVSEHWLDDRKQTRPKFSFHIDPDEYWSLDMFALLELLFDLLFLFSYFHNRRHVVFFDFDRKQIQKFFLYNRVALIWVNLAQINWIGLQDTRELFTSSHVREVVGRRHQT